MNRFQHVHSERLFFMLGGGGCHKKYRSSQLQLSLIYFICVYILDKFKGANNACEVVSLSLH